MKQMNIDVVRSILMSMSDVHESTIHGYPSFKMFGKILACPAIHKTAEPNSLLVKIPTVERDQLLAKEPHIYYVTDHYSKNAVILVRLSEIDRKSLRLLLENAHRLLNQGQRKLEARITKPMPALDSAPKKGRIK